jgi:hypothetical protein
MAGRDARGVERNGSPVARARRATLVIRGYTASQLRGKLIREFGKRYDVSGTGNYLVVHPVGQRDYWAQRFEDLYHSLRHYFHVRKFRLEKPRFPLVAVVFHNAGDMVRYARAEGSNIGPGVLGYYSPKSNRVVLYDRSGGKAAKEDWAENSATIIHEAAHQSAFNCGIHSRSAETPRWVVEGLGTMFEAPGVWDSRNHPTQSDRINRGRLADFRRIVAPNFNAASLSRFIGSDEPFGRNPSQAYATAWMLTFYLVEVHPMKYSKYLARTANRPPLARYTAKEREADFTAQFGDHFALHAAKILRFVSDLK